MIVKIKCRDGVIQTYMVAPQNLERLRAKHGENLEVLA